MTTNSIDITLPNVVCLELHLCRSLQCIICDNIPLYPMKCQKNHIYCKKCAKNLICISDETKVTYSNELQKQINKLRIKCPNIVFNGICSNNSNNNICKWEGIISAYKDHINNECPLRKVNCYYKFIGCKFGNDICQFELNDHMINYKIYHDKLILNNIKLQQNTMNIMQNEISQLKVSYQNEIKRLKQENALIKSKFNELQKSYPIKTKNSMSFDYKSIHASLIHNGNISSNLSKTMLPNGARDSKEEKAIINGDNQHNYSGIIKTGFPMAYNGPTYSFESFPTELFYIPFRVSMYDILFCFILVMW